MLAVPTCIGMSLTSDLIINVLLGSKWTEAGIYLQWLALATVLNAYYQPLYSLALAINRPSVIFRLTFIDLCFRMVLVSSGVYFYSLMGAVAARGAVSVIMFFAALLTARKLAGINMAFEVANQWRVAVSCAAMALLVLLLRHQLDGSNLNGLVELGITAAFGAMVYIGALYALGVRLRT
jgi:O-antigen/teichoic acid export membrane protein